MRILSKYMARTYLANLVLGLVIFTFVLMLDRLFELVDLLINKGVGLGIMAKLLFLLLPSSFSLTLPMSNLLAALLTFGHFSETNEITALRASGLSMGSFARGPMTIAVLSTAFLIPFNTRWAPHAHAHFRHLYLQILEQNPLVRIEEKTFFEIGEYHLYAERKERRSPRMSGVTIYKTPAQGAPLRIFAERGESAVDIQKGMLLTLYNGHIEEVDTLRPNRWFYTAFKTYLLTIPFVTQKLGSAISIQEMDDRQLQSEIDRLKAKQLPYPLFSCERHLRWALALTPALFVLLGIPLAIRIQRGGRSIGFGLSLGVVLVYYVLIMGGMGLGQRGVWPPALAVWTADLILAFVGSIFAWRLLQH